jgi:hypothetical protein
MSDAEIVQAPFRIVVDSREKMPYRFQGIRADANDGRRLIEVIAARGQRLAEVLTF